MNITIRKQLCELRSQKGNTQADLAKHLGISTQAVSKWERDEGYPDITLLPGIAAYYNVTIDDLLGVGEMDKQKRIQEYIAKDKELRKQGKTAERVQLWREAQKEFPNSQEVLHRLSFVLRKEDFAHNWEEIRACAEQLLQTATLSGHYFGALHNLCYCSLHVGDIEKAKEYAARCGRYIGTENQLLIHILQGEEAVACCRWNIETMVDLMAENVKVMIQKGNFDAEKEIQACQFVLKLYGLLMEDGNYGEYHQEVAKWNTRLENLISV